MKSKLFWLILIGICVLSKGAAWGRILELYEDEIDERSFSRPYSITHDFFVKNNSEVNRLISSGFFNPASLSDEARGEIHEALFNIIQNKRSYLVEHYERDLKSLQKDLTDVKTHFNKGQNCVDLSSEEITTFRREINALIKISTYLRTFDIDLRE